MEVFRWLFAHTDAQVDRILDAIDEIGRTDDTLIIYITGDNGASAEGTINRGLSAHRSKMVFTRTRNGFLTTSMTSAHIAVKTTLTSAGLGR